MAEDTVYVHMTGLGPHVTGQFHTWQVRSTYDWSSDRSTVQQQFFGEAFYCSVIALSYVSLTFLTSWQCKTMPNNGWRDSMGWWRDSMRWQRAHVTCSIVCWQSHLIPYFSCGLLKVLRWIIRWLALDGSMFRVPECIVQYWHWLWPGCQCLDHCKSCNCVQKATKCISESLKG